MPVFKVDVQTNIGNAFVTNVYHVNAVDMDDATTQAGIIVGLQRTVLPTGFTIDAMRISTPAEGDGIFNTVPLNVAGTRATSTDPMPMFCRFRVDFSVGFRRPLRKFLLVPLEGDQNSGTLTSTARAYVEDNYIEPLLASPDVNLCGADGTPVVSGVCNAQVGMRQLRRASKRTSPVI